MTSIVASLLAKELRHIANKLDAGSCELKEDEMLELFEMVGHIWLNKEQSCRLLNMSRATFDRNVASGRIPSGKKVAGYSELVWYRADLQKLSNI